MGITEEKYLVVLLSLWDMKGNATKAKALDNISSRGYYKLTPHDLSWKDNRAELVWRNNLAFIRKKLLDAEFLDDPARDCWTLTPKGKDRLLFLCRKVAQTNFFEKLTPNCVQRCKQVITEMM